jgi:hypothetical protein
MRKEKVMSDKETLAQWMIQRGYATGHGDTIEDLLVSLDMEIVDSWTKVLVNSVQGERDQCVQLLEKEGWFMAARIIKTRGKQ